jgi:type II secretory pathway pseudopilin PulG
MELAGQDDRCRSAGCARSEFDESGFILAVLLVGMAIAAVWMSALLPAWRHQAQREREAELVFRAEQYARAIVLFNRKYGTLPPSIDVLVDQKLLRKKYKDPITGCDFVPVGVGVIPPAQAGATAGAAGTPGCTGASNSIIPEIGQAQPPAPIIGVQAPGGQSGVAGQAGGQPGISGVRSISTAASIRIYQNQQQYNLFPFDYQLQCQKMGGCGQPGQGTGDGRGNRGTGVGDGRGRGSQSGTGLGTPGSQGNPPGPGGNSSRPGGGRQGGAQPPTGGNPVRPARGGGS